MGEHSEAKIAQPTSRGRRVSGRLANVGAPLLSVARLIDGQHHELGGADVDELLDQLRDAPPR